MQHWKVLKTKATYKTALARTVEIFHSEDGTNEADELELLLVLIKDYEDKHVVIPSADPLEMIKIKLEEKGLKMKDLGPLLGSRGNISSILSGKRSLTLKMAGKLHEFLGIPAEILLNVKDLSVPI